MSYPYPPLNIDPLAYEQTQNNPLPDAMSSPDQQMPQEENIQQDQQMPEDQTMMTDDQNQIAEDDQDNGGQPGYKRGGSVKNYHKIARSLESKGRRGDTILAHINPLEAAILKQMGGSGTINPKTGLPEYFLDKIGKFFKKIIAPIGLSILGNMLLPGAGGFLGGALGGMFGHPNDRLGPIGGALGGQAGLMGLNALGLASNSLGMTGLGSGLQSLGGQNYLASLMSNVSPTMAGYMGQQAAAPSFLTGWGNAAAAAGNVGTAGTAAGATTGAAPGFLSQMMTPQNLLSAASLGTTLLTRVSPEDQAKAQAKAQLFLDNELYKQSKKREEEFYNKMKLNVPETIFPSYKTGGNVSIPSSLPGRYLDGWTKGKADKVPATIDHHTPALLSDGEYVIPADVVAAVGDWNNKAGAKQFDLMVKKIRNHKGIPEKTPPAKNPLTYMMGA